MSASTYHAEDESEGFQINEPVEVGDLSDQSSGTDVIEPARGVGFIIKKAEVRAQLEDNKRAQSEDNRWKVKRLKLQLSVGSLGVDGEGRYANKVFFPELILTMNTTEFPNDFTSDWWKSQARGPFKEFLIALGYDVKQPPVIDDEFLAGLIGTELVADIQRVPVKRKDNTTGKYEATGDMENVIKNFKAAGA
jgi:hypothetical protein